MAGLGLEEGQLVRRRDEVEIALKAVGIQGIETGGYVFKDGRGEIVRAGGGGAITGITEEEEKDEGGGEFAETGGD